MCVRARDERVDMRTCVRLLVACPRHPVSDAGDSVADLGLFLNRLPNAGIKIVNATA